ncbi:MAG: thymidine phosphorylase [Xanthomonadales bacterium]|nr:thymidine phosphorylase [Xanthomonadales bacterium]
MQLAEEIILKKRDGGMLEAGDIRAFVRGISSGDVSDAQIAAFAMATWFRGMSIEEQMALTLAMRDSGDVMAWPDLDGPVLDKHSTGGVGDLVSLILGPVIAACGAYVPMISGRGLGHTGGTLDKLESIPGFEVALDNDHFRRRVQEHRLAIVGQTDHLAPADRRLYAVRDVTATVSSTPLIVSSILSKKLAEGLDALVLDVKFGSGAFQADAEAAETLAREITRVSCEAGVPCNALLTDMNQPLAWSAGNALEVREAIEFLRGDARHDRLSAVTLALCGELLCLGGLAPGAEAGATLARDALDSGRAAESFSAMVAGQGGPSDLLERPDRYLPAATVVKPVFPDRSGFITSIDTRAVGLEVVQLGGGRRRADDRIDPAVGVSGICSVGFPVDPDTPLAFIHAAEDAAWEHAAAALRAAVTIGEAASEAAPAIHGIIHGASGDEP